MIVRTSLAVALFALAGTAVAGSTQNQRSDKNGATPDSSAASGSSSASTKRSCSGLSGTEKTQCLHEEKGSSSSDNGMDAASGRNAGYGSNPSSRSSGGAASEGGGGGGGDGSSGSGSGH